MGEIFQKIQSGMVIIDPETHTILEVNPIAASLIGLPAGEICGSVCHRFICPAEKGRCPITDLGQEVDNSERILLGHNGSKIPVIKTVIRTTIDGMDYLIESFIDDRSRKIAEERRCALIGYIDEAVMRVQKPMELLEERVSGLIMAIEAGEMAPADARMDLSLLLKELQAMRISLQEVTEAILEGRRDIPEEVREFLKGR
jgi:PAS domain-containing protein